MPSHEHYSLDQLERREYDVMADLDPRLQRLIVRSLEDRTLTAVARPEEAAVIAWVSDVRAWSEHRSVRTMSVSPPLRDGSVIVTGRVPVDQIQSLRREPFVLSLKAAHRVRRQLSATVPELGADQLPASGTSNGGQGVVIGVVDNGCDFAHANFRSSRGCHAPPRYMGSEPAFTPGGCGPREIRPLLHAR